MGVGIEAGTRLERVKLPFRLGKPTGDVFTAPIGDARGSGLRIQLAAIRSTTKSHPHRSGR